MSPARMDRIEESIRTALKFHEALNRRDLPAALSLLAPACILEDERGGTHTGIDAIRRYLEETSSSASPRDADETFSFSLRSLVRWHARDGSAQGVDLYTVQDGHITRILSYTKA